MNTENLEKRYSKPPITEAVIALHFANSLDQKSIEKFASKQKTEFPRSETLVQHQFIEGSIPAAHTRNQQPDCRSAPHHAQRQQHKIRAPHRDRNPCAPSPKFVLEYYGHATHRFHSVVHVWKNHKSVVGREKITTVPPGALVQDFNTFGVEVTADWTTFYLNGNQIWRTASEPEFSQPLYVLLNLALGSGWPPIKSTGYKILTFRDIRSAERSRTAPLARERQ